MTDPDIIKIEARLTEAQETEKYAVARVKALTEALATAKLAQENARQLDQAARLESKLEAQKWITAKSGKCDYLKNPPADLVAAVDEKEGFKGTKHHFTRTKDGMTLFRFARSVKT